jgi:hypothetical protein
VGACAEAGICEAIDAVCVGWDGEDEAGSCGCTEVAAGDAGGGLCGVPFAVFASGDGEACADDATLCSSFVGSAGDRGAVALVTIIAPPKPSAVAVNTVATPAKYAVELRMLD